MFSGATMKIYKPQIMKKLLERRFRFILSKLTVELYPHQIDGIKWMIWRELWTFHKGGILADDMGLGKTIQTLSTIVSNLSIGTTLIIAPPSLLTQWYGDIKKWYPELIVGIYHGKNRNHILSKGFDNYDIVLTSYGMVTQKKVENIYYNFISKYHWGRLVLDEGHTIRNNLTKVFKGISTIESNIKWVLTGTPVHNSSKDAINLLSFIGIEKDEYSNGTRDTNSIINMLDRYLLRRTKDVLEKTLYKKVNIVPVELQNQEMDLYKRQHNLTLQHMELFNTINNNIHIFAWLTKLRQVSIHPQLLINSYQKKSKWADLDSKFSVLHKMISSHPKEGSLVFCHYKEEMDILYNKLIESGLSVFKYNGNSTKNEKNEILAKCRDIDYKKYIQYICSGYFNHLPYLNTHIQQKIHNYCKVDVLLMQIQSGSVGLNLQQLNRVYFTSPVWNPAIEDQAIGRCYRIGQEKEVIVTKLVSVLPEKEDLTTFEQRVINIQQSKRLIQSQLLKDPELNYNGTMEGNLKLSPQDISYLLGA